MENKIDIQNQANSAPDFDLSSTRLITLATYAVAGFIAGFIFKHFGKTIVTIIILSAIILGILTYFNFISINCENIKNFLGITNGCTVTSIARSYLEYLQLHIVESLAVAVGFLLGWTYT